MSLLRWSVGPLWRPRVGLLLWWGPHQAAQSLAQHRRGCGGQSPGLLPHRPSFGSCYEDGKCISDADSNPAA